MLSRSAFTAQDSLSLKRWDEGEEMDTTAFSLICGNDLQTLGTRAHQLQRNRKVSCSPRTAAVAEVHHGVPQEQELGSPVTVHPNPA